MSGLIGFLDRHTGAIQALGAILTVLIGVSALIGVKVQLDATERLAREQSARDIYREYLNVSISKPELANPNYCDLIETPNEGAYEHYVDYYLYTAEQVLAVDPDWQSTLIEGLKPHAAYACAITELTGYSEPVQGIVKQFQTTACASVKPCPAQER